MDFQHPTYHDTLIGPFVIVLGGCVRFLSWYVIGICLDECNVHIWLPTGSKLWYQRAMLMSIISNFGTHHASTSHLSTIYTTLMCNLCAQRVIKCEHIKHHQLDALQLDVIKDHPMGCSANWCGRFHINRHPRFLLNKMLIWDPILSALIRLMSVLTPSSDSWSETHFLDNIMLIRPFIIAENSTSDVIMTLPPLFALLIEMIFLAHMGSLQCILVMICIMGKNRTRHYFLDLQDC